MPVLTQLSGDSTQLKFLIKAFLRHILCQGDAHVKIILRHSMSWMDFLITKVIYSSCVLWLRGDPKATAPNEKVDICSYVLS